MADVNPNSWRYTSILLLPGTRCYERFTDDTIDNTRKVIIDGIAGLGLTPRGKSRFQLVTDAFTNPGSFASKIASAGAGARAMNLFFVDGSFHHFFMT